MNPVVAFPTFSVTIVPCLRDNYAYSLTAPGSAPGDAAIVIDAGDAAPVNAALAGPVGSRLGAILATHHHLDHVGGRRELLEKTPNIPVFGSAYDGAEGRIFGQTRRLEDGETFDVPFRASPFAGVRVQAFHVPGHTLGALAYLVEGVALFTGDTWFLGGCGRLFEGTPAQMRESLMRMAALGDDIAVFPGHEYTVGNLSFAVATAETPARAQALRAAQEARAAGRPTVPSTIGAERQTNPFLQTADVAEFAKLRAAKDVF
jgi:hydroxyacylglutathione hydrolase